MVQHINAAALAEPRDSMLADVQATERATYHSITHATEDACWRTFLGGLPRATAATRNLYDGGVDMGHGLDSD
jgi:hypothetical protein